jgi:hypothetical protein
MYGAKIDNYENEEKQVDKILIYFTLGKTPITYDTFFFWVNYLHMIHVIGGVTILQF